MKTRKRVVCILVALGVLVLAVASAHFEGALPVATSPPLHGHLLVGKLAQASMQTGQPPTTLAPLHAI